MRKNSPQYKQWVYRRNRKNLIIRSRKKLFKKQRKTNFANYNYKIKKEFVYNNKSKNFTFIAPLNFSIVNNPEETISFFNSIIGFITDKRNYRKKLFIDISKIQSLTTDALMYLLSIVNNLNENFHDKYTFSGNAPSSPEVRKKFNESGFYSFVKYFGRELLTHNDDNVQIVSGESYDTETAKKITDFVILKAGLRRNQCKFLYEAVIELMNNTQKHAYNKNDLLYPRWYCYVEYHNSNLITFTFMDTGAGIPTTVQKKFAEKLDLLKLIDENKYVVSALKGEFRTATKKYQHGKGLPKIRDFCAKEVMNDLIIVTNKANVFVQKDSIKGKDLPVQLKGTLYNWKIDINRLKEII